jgi:Heterokaryon incompatibility protein (HET)
LLGGGLPKATSPVRNASGPIELVDNTAVSDDENDPEKSAGPNGEPYPEVSRALVDSDLDFMQEKMFSYQPLKQNQSVRFLRLLQTARLACQLESHDLSSNSLPPYVALSYTWGDSVPRMGNKYNDKNNRKYPIHVDGGLMRVGRSPFQALLRLRDSKYQTFPLWIDAICINQNNLAERNSQVSQMGDIYSQATTVVVWLGEEDEHAKFALPTINKVVDAVKSSSTMTPENLPLAVLKNADSFWSRTTLSAPSEEEWYAIRDFYARCWFRRVWVVQEVGLAADVAVLCGDGLWSWDTLTAFSILLICSSWESSPHLYGSALAEHHELGWNALYRMQKLRGYHEAAKLNVRRRTPMIGSHTCPNFNYSDPSHNLCASLIFAMFGLAGLASTDPRDKVFAPLVLVMRFQTLLGCRPFLPKANYGKSEEAVYFDICSFLVERSCCLNLLSFAGYRGVSLESELLTLPSWVPDFKTLKEGHFLEIHHNHKGTRLWTSSSNGEFFSSRLLP